MAQVIINIEDGNMDVEVKGIHGSAAEYYMDIARMKVTDLKVEFCHGGRIVRHENSNWVATEAENGIVKIGKIGQIKYVPLEEIDF